MPPNPGPPIKVRVEPASPRVTGVIGPVGTPRAAARVPRSGDALRTCGTRGPGTPPVESNGGEFMAGKLDGKRIAILATDGVEQVELTGPRDAVTREGARTEIVSLSEGEIQAMNGDIEPADRFTADRSIREVSADDYDALLMPGGTVNADRLRDGRRRRRLRAGRVPRREAGRRDLPRPVDAGRGRSRARADADVLPEPAHRHPQRGRRTSSTRRSSRTTGWSRVATRTTCRRSARRSWRSSPRARTARRRKSDIPRTLTRKCLGALVSG